jgi:TM2 domain-containing membrane protein YozV/Tfp pilus assembly major pilin PilA
MTIDSLAHGEMISCNACKKEIHSSASTCPHCGAPRRSSRYKSKTVAALFAFFLGGFGGHRFYLGQWWGIFYLFFFWLWIPGLVAFCEFIYFLICDARKWDEKYNEGIPAGPNDKSSGVLIAVLIVFGGFTLIAVLGILAAIALPAYQDYTIRSKLTESHTSASSVMRAVESYASENGQWPANINDVEIDAKIVTEFVDSIAVDNGAVYVTPSSAVGVEGGIIYVPSESETGISWSCKASTLESKYLPQKCR